MGRYISTGNQICDKCVHYEIEGISERCMHPANLYENWIGLCFKQSPRNKNVRGYCEFFESKYRYSDIDFD